MVDASIVALLWTGFAAGCLGVGHGLATGLSIAAFAVAALAVGRGRWQAAPLAALAVLQCALLATAAGGALSPLTGGLVALGNAASSLFLWWWPVPHLDRPTGPHAVGIQIVEFPMRGDAPGDAPRAVRADGRRWQQLYLWYPARAGTGSPPRPLHTGPEACAFAGTTRALGGLGFLLHHFRLARTHSREGAAVEAGEFPVVVFNHGGAMWPTQNFGLMEELASHGYIVCSVAHPGESAGVVWADGDGTSIGANVVAAIRMNSEALRDQASFQLSQDEDQRRSLLPALAGHFEPTLTATTRRWAADSIAAVDHLMSEPTPPAVAAIVASTDFSRLAYAGMSLGGSAAFECCFADPRASAGINLDGTNWCFDRIDQVVPVPFLQIYGDPFVNIGLMKDKARPGIQPPTELTPDIRMPNDDFYEVPAGRGARDDVVRVIVRGAGHMAFTDHALSARGPIRKLMGIGRANGRSVSRLVAQLSRTFLDQHLRAGSPTALEAVLSASSAVVRQKLKPVPAAAHRN